MGTAGRVVADLGDRDEMHGVVELAVASPVEPVALSRSAGCLDGAVPLQ
jgi:hypothetical protein